MRPGKVSAASALWLRELRDSSGKSFLGAARSSSDKNLKFKFKKNLKCQACHFLFLGSKQPDHTRVLDLLFPFCEERREGHGADPRYNLGLTLNTACPMESPRGSFNICLETCTPTSEQLSQDLWRWDLALVLFINLAR